MTFFANKIQKIDKLNDFLGLILIGLSAILLAIWAVSHTIALRNIVLVTGSILSIFYITLNWHKVNVKHLASRLIVLPLFLIALLFFWILYHFSYLTTYRDIKTVSHVNKTLHFFLI